MKPNGLLWALVVCIYLIKYVLLLKKSFVIIKFKMFPSFKIHLFNTNIFRTEMSLIQETFLLIYWNKRISSSKYINLFYFFLKSKPAAKIEYYVSPTLQGGGYVDEDDLDQPSYKNIKLKLQQQVPGLKVVETALVQKPSASEEKESVSSIFIYL